MTRRDQSYQETAPAMEAVQTMTGMVLLDFGTDWCGHCVAARAAVDHWIGNNPTIDHLRIEDGRERALGRAFRVKLWPTLVFVRQGKEVGRLVRPREESAIRDALALLKT